MKALLRKGAKARLPEGYDVDKQGRTAPWRLYQNYARDVLLMRHGVVADEGVRFSRAPGPVRAADAETSVA